MRKSGINKNTQIMNKAEFARFLSTKRAYDWEYHGYNSSVGFKPVTKYDLLHTTFFYKITFVSKKVKFGREEFGKCHWDILHWGVSYNNKNNLYYVTRYNKERG